jgi:hypothetical protein
MYIISNPTRIFIRDEISEKAVIILHGGVTPEIGLVGCPWSRFLGRGKGLVSPVMSGHLAKPELKGRSGAGLLSQGHQSEICYQGRSAWRSP